MIDQVHQRPDGTARDAFQRNKRRFIEKNDTYIIGFSEKNVLHAFDS
ncbi:hypothetical protein ABLA30_21350 [Xenorhabdus nematophila]